jgi:hypothetical protein
VNGLYKTVLVILLLKLPVFIERMLMTQLGRNLSRIQQNSWGTPISVYTGGFYCGDWTGSLKVVRARRRRRRRGRVGGGGRGGGEEEEDNNNNNNVVGGTTFITGGTKFTTAEVTILCRSSFW